MNPTLSLPKTTATSELLRAVLALIPHLADTPFLAARERWATAFESISGARCGEVFGAQIGHGVMADGVSILTWVGQEGYECPPTVSVGEEFVEASTETSKTKLGRCFTMVGQTKGPARVDLAGALRSYWEACEFKVTRRREEGWQVERPDFSVLQISLMGLTTSATKMDALRRWLGPGDGATSIAQVRRVAAALKTELAEKARITKPEVEKMFLNVIGGSRADEALDAAQAELLRAGIESTITRGPLIMKTKGKTQGNARGGKDSIWIPQPLQSGSTYDFLHRVMDAAYVKLKEDDPDYDMRLGGDRKDPRFAHNSWRRLAATTAEAAKLAKKVSKEDVELQFGWQLRKHAKQMRLHYAERGARAMRARMTEMI